MYRMLIVDDEKNERDCILYLLKNSGLPLEIREAEDGVAALALLKGWPAHILFTDVQMPRMGGLELIQKALALYPDIRPIIFSGYADFAYIVHGGCMQQVFGFLFAKAISQRHYLRIVAHPHHM